MTFRISAGNRGVVYQGEGTVKVELFVFRFSACSND